MKKIVRTRPTRGCMPYIVKRKRPLKVAVNLKVL